MSKRKKNPSVALILLTVTGVAVGGYALYQVFKPKKKKPTRRRIPPPEKKGSTKTSSTKNWPSELTGHDKEQLQVLGYSAHPQVVLRFQQDFNAVNAELLAEHETPMANVTILEDNDIGDETRAAMILALEESKGRLMSWPEMVLTYG